MAELCAAALAGDLKTARAINTRLLPLHCKLFVESNPTPLKWAMQRMGRIEGGIRLPMTPLESRNHPVVEAALRQSGVLA
jgi:4-hydroxy-tetrahydrodipicolinate synthase